jgi:hypothetical protein
MYQVDSCSDVFVDACVRNQAGILMFISVYGRDTAIKELMARIQIGKGSEGLSELKLKGCGVHLGESHVATIGNAKDLAKLTGRLSKCLYGNLTHAWIFDPAIRAPDKGAGQAWVIEPKQADDPQQGARIAHRLWQAVCHLAAVPLLPHWQTTVMQSFGADLVCQMGTTDGGHNPWYSKPLGDVLAYRVRLGDDFSSRICTLVQNGDLTLHPQALPAQLEMV